MDLFRTVFTRKSAVFLRVVLILSFIAGIGCATKTNYESANRHPAQDPALFKGKGSFPIWDYDGGPLINTDAGKALVNLNSAIPYFPGLSQSIYGDQMFRPAFGPIPWRMMQKPNSVKILFIGQDGTHIAEAANRPATAGFGGRAQDLAQYFGVGSSAAFINAYAFTIRWQYGAFDTPVVTTGPDGRKTFSTTSFTGNPVWLVSQDKDSPLVQWRNDLIEWIINNNKDSLKMIVMFGGAARDAVGTFVESNGGKVGTRYSEADLGKVRIPEFTLVGAGSNKQTAVPLTREGKDLYAEFAGRAPKYTDPPSVKKVQTDFKADFDRDPDKWMRRMVFSEGGVSGSGMIHPAQLGGYDVDKKMEINGQRTISLKGLKLRKTGLTISSDILVAELPHPTSLSMTQMDEINGKVPRGTVAKTVGQRLAAVREFRDRRGWKISSDPGFTNTFAEGKDYRYGRGDMGTEYYDFGAPNSRMVNVSDAVRVGKNLIVFGTREQAGFKSDPRVKAIQSALPSRMPSDSEMWTTRAIGPQSRWVFDPGPPEAMAKIMKSTLPRDEAFLKAHAANGDFGHYRGTFKSPKVVILADPDGYDDLNTSRALTGTRGQYLHSLMEGMGVGEQYLVIKTAPYEMGDDWADVFERTKEYRMKLISAVLEAGTPSLILTDGAYAKQEIGRIVTSGSVPVVSIDRTGEGNSSGIADALARIRAISGFSNASFSGKMADLPRSHLTYYARMWEGTSGDRVIASRQPGFKNKAFALIAPNWATAQKYEMSREQWAAIEKLNSKLCDGRLRFGGESISAFLSRQTRGGCPSLRGVKPAVGEVPDEDIASMNGGWWEPSTSESVRLPASN